MAKYDVKYNPSLTPIPGTTQLGYVAVATGQVDYTTGGWVAGIDDTTGYVIYSDTTSTNLVGRTTAGGTGTASADKPTFWKTTSKTDGALLFLINRLPGSPGTFSTATEAKAWLNNSANYGVVETVTGGKGQISLVTIDGVDNFNYAVLDFESSNASLIDSNIDSNLWACENIVPVTNRGYMVIFRDTSDSSYYKFQFISYDGTLVDEYTPVDSIYDNNYNSLILWAYFDDITNGIVKIFDGINTPVTITYDPSLSEVFSIPGDWNQITSNGDMVFKIRNTNTTVDEYYILKPDGTYGTPFKTINYSNYYVEYLTSIASDFIVELIQDITGDYLSLSILDNTSSVLHSTSLTASNVYNNQSREFIGSNKFYIIFSNTGDINIDYQIIKYDSTIPSYNVITHPRGTAFESYSTIADDGYDVDRNNNEMGCIFLYSNTYDSTSGGFNYYTDFNIIPFVEGISVPTTITFSSNQTLGTYQYGTNNNSYIGGGIFLEVKVDGAYKILTLKDDGGFQYTTLSSDESLINDSSNRVFGDKLWIAPYDNSNILTSLPSYVISKNGLILDTYTFSGTNISISNDYSYNVIYLKDNNGTGSVYFNNNNVFTETAITTTNEYVPDSTYFDLVTFRRTGNIILVDNNNDLMRLISVTGSTGDISFPIDYDSNFDISAGSDYFLFKYTKSDTSIGCIFYDYFGNELQTLPTTTDDSYNMNVVQNRAFIRTGNGPYTMNLFSPTGQDSVTYSTHIRDVTNDTNIYWC